MQPILLVLKIVSGEWSFLIGFFLGVTLRAAVLEEKTPQAPERPILSFVGVPKHSSFLEHDLFTSFAQESCKDVMNKAGRGIT